jgi:hypothetical protein
VERSRETSIAVDEEVCTSTPVTDEREKFPFYEYFLLSKKVFHAWLRASQWIIAGEVNGQTHTNTIRSMLADPGVYLCTYTPIRYLLKSRVFRTDTKGCMRFFIIGIDKH